jgi:hypothetical protein
MITAIIIRYFPERLPNLEIIIKALLASTMPPDEIIVWNNEDCHLPIQDKRIVTINSSKNFGPWARYCVALMARNEWCFVEDDDVAVRPTTLKQFYDARRPDRILSNRGVLLGKTENPYINREYIHRPGETDISGGGLIFCHKQVVLNAFQYLVEHPDIKIVREDDLLLCLVNKKHGGINLIEPVEYDDLDEFGIGLCYQPGHYELRNEFCKRMLS